MGDEEDPWGFDGGDDTPAAPAETTPAPGTPAAVASKVASPATKGASPASKQSPGGSRAPSAAGDVGEGGEEAVEEQQPPPPPPEDDGYRKPVQLYRHWVRPKFLQYKYMYNYRTNYYNDVIDYLDKKQTGVKREIPRPQTWAERVLRTNNADGHHYDNYIPLKKDAQLTQTLAATIRTHNYHTKAYINQKYSHIL